MRNTCLIISADRHTTDCTMHASIAVQAQSCRQTDRWTDNHTITLPLSFLQARCSSCHPTNSVKALKAWGSSGNTQQRHKMVVVVFFPVTHWCCMYHDSRSTFWGCPMKGYMFCICACFANKPCTLLQYNKPYGHDASRYRW